MQVINDHLAVSEAVAFTNVGEAACLHRGHHLVYSGAAVGPDEGLGNHGQEPSLLVLDESPEPNPGVGKQLVVHRQAVEILGIASPGTSQPAVDFEDDTVLVDHSVFCPFLGIAGIPFPKKLHAVQQTVHRCCPRFQNGGLGRNQLSAGKESTSCRYCRILATWKENIA